MRFLLNGLGFDGFEVSLLFVSENTIKGLNTIHKKKAVPTNVLSFSYGFDFFLLGDVVINIDWVNKRAFKEGLDQLDVIIRLLVHGLVHLAGYDHEKGTYRALVMEALEKRLLLSIYTNKQLPSINGIFE